MTPYKALLTALPAAAERLPVSGHDVVVSSSSAFAQGVQSDEGAVHVCCCYTPFCYAIAVVVVRRAIWPLAAAAVLVKPRALDTRQSGSTQPADDVSWCVDDWYVAENQSGSEGINMVDKELPPSMRQRSLRLPAATLEALDQLAAERGQSANALASRLIEQGLRTERHPLISFRDGEAGRRPALLGSRLDVWQVVDIVRENGGSLAEAAQHLGQPEIKIQAALRYYTEYRDEVDAWAQRMREIADSEERAFSASASRPA